MTKRRALTRSSLPSSRSATFCRDGRDALVHASDVGRRRRPSQPIRDDATGEALSPSQSGSQSPRCSGDGHRSRSSVAPSPADTCSSCSNEAASPTGTPTPIPPGGRVSIEDADVPGLEIAHHDWWRPFGTDVIEGGRIYDGEGGVVTIARYTIAANRSTSAAFVLRECIEPVRLVVADVRPHRLRPRTPGEHADPVPGHLARVPPDDPHAFQGRRLRTRSCRIGRTPTAAPARSAVG